MLPIYPGRHEENTRILLRVAKAKGMVSEKQTTGGALNLEHLLVKVV
jgi:hypothetical protein